MIDVRRKESNKYDYRLIHKGDIINCFTFAEDTNIRKEAVLSACMDIEIMMVKSIIKGLY